VTTSARPIANNFDYFPIRAQQLLEARQGTERIAFARSVGRGRLITAIACAAVFPIALTVAALAALALVAAVWIALHAYEIIWWREARAAARALRATT
jgi:hypothetical protein